MIEAMTFAWDNKMFYAISERYVAFTRYVRTDIPNNYTSYTYASRCSDFKAKIANLIFSLILYKNDKHF